MFCVILPVSAFCVCPRLPGLRTDLRSPLFISLKYNSLYQVCKEKSRFETDTDSSDASRHSRAVSSDPGVGQGRTET